MPLKLCDELGPRADQPRVDRHRPLGRLAEVEALAEVDAEVAHGLELADALDALGDDARLALVRALDERGERLTTAALTERLSAYRRDGRDVVFLIGGPDGLDPALKAGVDESWRLSDLTLPHGFVRVLLAEALYRAWTVTTHHPYHRE